MKTTTNSMHLTRTALMGLLCTALGYLASTASAQNIFVKLSTSTSVSNTIAGINPPSGYPYSAAAPFAGTSWNVIGMARKVPAGTAAPFDTNLYVNVPLVNSSGASIAPTLTVSYHLGTATGTRTEPSTGSGENVIQPGGVMQNAWRNFSTGNYATFTITNLTANGQYGLFIYGGTTTSGQGCQATNISGQAQTVSTTNNSANSAGAFGSIWTVSGGSTNLMPQGKTWNFTTCAADANGIFSFRYGVPSDSNYRFYNGFQLVPLTAASVTGPTNQTIIAGNAATLTTSVSGFPTPTLQWWENGTNVVGATNTTLVLPNVQYSQNGFTYSLVASNAVNVLTNTMTLTVLVTPAIGSLPNQAVYPGTDVVISATVTGVPAPALQWQLNDVNLTDGPTTNGGSGISGSTTSTLTITNAQTGDSGIYCLIASNSVSAVTNCMSLLVSSNPVPPQITGPTDQTVIQSNNATFSASVLGLPVPTVQWQENGTDVPGATSASLTLLNVPFAKDGFVYSIIASNSQGTATNIATLHVLVPPSITNQPQSLVVTNTQGASFTVGASGVPAPAYQWYKGGSPISSGVNPTATNATLTFASASPSDMGSYSVVVSNAAGTVTSSSATLTVNSTMAAVSLSPTNGATAVCYDTPLYVAFDRAPVLRSSGLIRIYISTNSLTPVDTLDMSLNAGNGTQARTIAGESFNTYPVLITGNQAAIYPHLGVLTSNRTYYVTVDNGVFADTNGAFFAGITDTNAWRLSTKPTGPANPTSIVVAADGSGDFVTVQGAVDFVPGANTTPRLVSIRNGSYVEIVDVNGKSNLTFRGQSRTGTVVGYANNATIAPGGSTHSRMAFKVNASDIAIENLTVLNRTPKGGGQAEALMLETGIKRFILNNAEVDSYQDTILGNTISTQAYFNNSLIQGDVDYIWGAMNLFATNCEIRTVTAGGNITQGRSDALSNGMSFVNCRLTGASNGVINVTLGRAISVASSTVAFVSCQIDTNTIIGWNSGDIGNPSLGLRWWEYGNSNLTATAAAVFNGIQLTNGDVNLTCAQSATCWLYGWIPQLAPNITGQPVSLVVTAGQPAVFSVTATGIPDPTYQWLKNGTNVFDATGATLVISNAQDADAAIYSVVVSNIAGAVTSSNATLTVINVAPTVNFTASPTSGTEPLTVTFTDTSAGTTPISLTWDLGDSTTTNTAGSASFVHAYGPGTYTVTLTASNSVGTSALVSNNLITVAPTPFHAWQLQYFNCTNCPDALPDADPDGDGQNNAAEFLAGTNPTNSLSALRIISAVRQTTDVVITWAAGAGTTNAVQATAGDAGGNYTNTFSDISDLILIQGSGDVTTNYVDVGAATNSPSRYYRVRLVP